MSSPNQSRKIETNAVHGGMEGLAEHGSHVPPIDFSTTNPLPDVEHGGLAYEQMAGGGRPGPDQSHVYQRLWQPGVARFEEGLAALEGTDEAVAFATGMAAMSAVLMAMLKTGKRHVVALRPLYGGTDHVLDTGLFSTEVSWADEEDVSSLIRPDTGLVIVESPANPTLELVDIAAICRAAGDVPVLVDNTFATPMLQRPTEQGASLVLHSATKYLGGHGDVMGGVIACGPVWAERIRSVRALTGALLNPFAAYLLHRGLRTLPIRVRAQQETAGKLASMLSEHSGVVRTLYPGLAGQDPRGLLGTQQSGPGSMVAFEVAGGHEGADRMVEACSLIGHAVSLGGVDTLVQVPASLTHRPVASAAKPAEGIVRMSVGLEHVDDLVADLDRALNA